MGFVMYYDHLICYCGCCVWLCQRVCEFYNVIDHLVCWLVIVYNVCIFHIVQWCLVWGLLVVCVKFLGLCECFYMFSISCFEGSTCLTNIVIGTVVTFKFVNTCGCVFFMYVTNLYTNIPTSETLQILAQTKQYTTGTYRWNH